MGQLLATPWPVSSTTLSWLGDPDGVKHFSLLCFDLALPGHGAHATRARATHLRAFHTDPAQDAARARQVKRIHDLLHTRILSQHQAVVVGGDFNTTPQQTALNYL